MRGYCLAIAYFTRPGNKLTLEGSNQNVKSLFVKLC
jgi:hypothetical protein